MRREHDDVRALSGVSVCIPVYNGARYLEETLQSVVSQGNVDLEIIVGDDGSTDGSQEIAKSFASHHPDHEWVFLSSVRLGMAGNWNTCIGAATKEYVKVIGQDDLLYEGILCSQAAVLSEKANVSLVVSGCDIISARGKKLFTRPRKRKTGIYPGSDISKDCLDQRANLVGEPVTVMARRTDLLKDGGFSSAHRYYIDLEQWLRLLAIGDCAVIAEPQCAFRIHGRAVSSSSQESDFDQFDSLPGALDVLYSLSPLQRHIRQSKARFFTHVRSLLYRIFG